MASDRLDPSLYIADIAERVSAADCAAAAHYPTATLHEAGGKIGALPSAIKPVVPSFRFSGPAVTVFSPPGDNLWIHRGLYAAQPGDVLVVYVGGAYEHGYWGEIMSTAAKERGLAGLVIDGGVRDVTLLEEIGFPVFARGLCIRGTGKDFAAPGSVNAPLWLGDVSIFPGDLVVGDIDGVVSIPRARAAEVIEASRVRTAYEEDICERLKRGETTLDIYGWS